MKLEGQSKVSAPKPRGPAAPEVAAPRRLPVAAESYERSREPGERPHPTSAPDKKSSLLGLRRFVDEAGDRFTYSQGQVNLRPDGTLSFVDLTMEQVELAKCMTSDPAQLARLEELETDWPGGKDPLAGPASYVALFASGELDERIRQLEEIKERDAYGVYARARAKTLRIGGANLNVGEEREISGVQGSGTVYFSSCSMKCSFCQYADLSQLKGGGDLKVKELAKTFLDLQERGAHNIQLMTPSHYALEIVKAVKLAAAEGLEIPLVWNTGGYEDLDALRALDGIVDVYLPDVKFGNEAASVRYGGTPGYFENAKAAVREMFRQVGNLETDERGVATRGVMVRHLIMPGDVADARPIAEFLASVSKDLRVSLLDQWTPDFAVPNKQPEIDRPVTREEVARTRQIFAAAGLAVEPSA